MSENVLRQLANPCTEPADIDTCLGYATLRVDDEQKEVRTPA
jgi:hypothetical protein